MKRLATIITTLLLILVPVSAQEIISGRVIQKNDEVAVVGANVIIKSSERKIVAFATTDENGSFKLELPAWSEGLSIHISMIGMKAYSAPLKEKQGILEIAMEEGALQLKEVEVKAGRIREHNDTIAYRVSGFAQKQDRTIGDVLRRMPGIDVASDGKIQYQGTNINKFYIEGSDLLGGKYGIATNSISHDDVGSIEVMENHQPMQVLRGFTFSDQAALNLKLKNKSKAVWLVNGYLGGGWTTNPEGGVWSGELFLMTVLSRYQTITTLKSNNIGTDLRNQVRDFLDEGRNTGLKDYIYLQLPSTPSLKESRTFFNRSWMFSSSHLWKMKTYETKAQIDYFNHRASASSSSVSTYFLNNGDKIITEERRGKEHDNRLTAKFSIQANQKKYYLDNTLKTELNWDEIETIMSGTIPNSQYGKMPDYYVSNELKLIKRFGDKHLVTFTSVNEWESKPERLFVTYADGRDFTQRISNQAFYTNERAEYGFHTHGFSFAFEGGINGYLRGMDSNLSAETGGLIDKTFDNDVTTDYLSFFVSPKIGYATRRIDITLSYPLNYTYYVFNQQIGNKSEYFQSPSLNVRWKPNPRLSISVSGGLGRSPMELQNIHDGTLLTDYRTFTRGIEQFYANSRQNITGRLLYRNGSKGIFASAIAVKTWNSIPYKGMQNFIEDFIVYSFENSPSNSQTLNIIANIGKSFDFMRGGVSFNGSYSRMGNTLLSEGVSTLYHNTSWNIGGRIHGNVFNWLYLSYDPKFINSQLAVNRELTRSLNRYVHGFCVVLTPIESLSWETGGEYYRNELTEDYYKGLFLLDTKLTWRMSRRIEFRVSMTNILNRKTYSYTTYGTLSSLESTRFLRGRECMLTLYLKK